MEMRIVLKTSEERVRLLKKGIEGKAIEEIYIRSNGLKIVKGPVLFDFIKTTLRLAGNRIKANISK